VAVASSAFEWACETLPEDHTLVLVHGIHQPEFHVKALPDGESTRHSRVEREEKSCCVVADLPLVPAHFAGKWMMQQRHKAFEEYEFMQSSRIMQRYSRLCRDNGVRRMNSKLDARSSRCALGRM
jgi:hypothetical protein